MRKGANLGAHTIWGGSQRFWCSKVAKLPLILSYTYNSVSGDPEIPMGTDNRKLINESVFFSLNLCLYVGNCWFLHVCCYIIHIYIYIYLRSYWRVRNPWILVRASLLLVIMKKSSRNKTLNWTCFLYFCRIPGKWSSTLFYCSAL